MAGNRYAGAACRHDVTRGPGWSGLDNVGHALPQTHTHLHMNLHARTNTYIHVHTHNIHAVRAYAEGTPSKSTLISPVCAGKHIYIDMRIFTTNQIVILVPAQE